MGDKISASLKVLVIALYVVPMASSAGGGESRMGRGGKIVGGLGSRWICPIGGVGSAM